MEMNYLEKTGKLTRNKEPHNIVWFIYTLDIISFKFFLPPIFIYLSMSNVLSVPHLSHIIKNKHEFEQFL